jgi:dephospho-CoA kinase
MKTIIGTAGEIASGKETVAQYIIKKYGGSLYRFSDPLRDILLRMHLAVDRKNYHLISMALRNYFGQDSLSKIVFNDINKKRDKIIVIDGIRRQSDLKYLKNIRGFKLIFIEADLKKRFERLKARREKADDQKKSLSSFKKEHESEVEMNIRKLKKIADFIIDNNQGHSRLFSAIDAVLGNIIKK